MKFLYLGVAMLLVLTGCAATEAPPEGTVSETAESVGPAEGFRTAEEFDADDVVSLRASRDAWVTAFAAGDTEALEFVFDKDAVTALPADIRDLSGEEFFSTYDAEITFDESSERYITDGGDPRVMTRLPWVSFYSDYELRLTPKAGGEAIENRGRFMTRFHRQPDESLKVIRGPSLGDPAPLFALNDMKSGAEVQLADLFGQKPSVLVFGSYT
jgi:hypothetical protein